MGKKIRDLKSSRAHRISDTAKCKRPKRASKRDDGRFQEVTAALGMRGEDSGVLFWTFIEQANELILATDTSGKMTFVNPEISRVTGYTAGELLGKSPVDLVVPEARNTAAIAAEMVLRGERVRRIEVEITSKDARRIFLEVRGRPLNLRGHPVGVLYIARDVTARKQAERKLVESEQKFRGLVEGTAAPVAVTDLMGRFTYVNKALADLLGYSTQELSGQPFADFLHPEDIPKVMELFVRASSSSRDAPDIEFRVLRKDGSIRNLRSRPTRLAICGKTVGFEAIMTDITEHNRMEERLRQYSSNLEQLVAERTSRLTESEKRFRELADLLPQIVFEIDDNGNILFMNRGAFAATGCTEEDFRRGLNAFQMFVTGERERAMRGIRRTMAGETIGGREFTVLRRDHTTFPVVVYTDPMMREGKTVGVRGIAIDITERKRMEDELRAAKERLDYVVTSNPAVIFTAKPRSDLTDYDITYMSANLVSILGYEPREFVDNPKFWEEHLQPEDWQRFLAEVPRLFESGHLSFEYCFPHQNGTYCWVHEEAKVVRDSAGNPQEVIGYLTDVTERKHMEEALLRSERLAAIGEMAATVAHDLRNPLTGISGAAYHLKKKLGPVADEKSNEMLELIERDIEYANRIMSELLEYSADLRLELAEAGLRSIVEEALFLVHVPSNIRVSNLTSDQPRVEVDTEYMKRVFVNLIKNSIEAMSEGGELTIRSAESDGKLQIYVSDTGAGIADEAAGRIWAPFFTTKAKGIGLGLSVCRRIVEAHKGHISFRTEVGEGTTFTLTIPILVRKHD
jgi:PAS domain S-box-containing protein